MTVNFRRIILIIASAAMMLEAGCGFGSKRNQTFLDYPEKAEETIYEAEFTSIPDEGDSALGYLISCFGEEYLYYAGENEKGEPVVYRLRLPGGDGEAFLTLEEEIGITGLWFKEDGTLNLMAYRQQKEAPGRSQVIYQFDTEGKFRGMVPVRSTVEENLVSPAATSGGKLFVKGIGKENRLLEITDTGELREVQADIPLYIGGTGQTQSDEGILVYDQEWLYSFDGRGACRKILRWEDVSILSESVRALLQTEEEIMVLVTDSSGKRGEIATLRKKEEGAAGQPERLVLAAVRASGFTKKIIADFNRSQRECHIEIREYLSSGKNVTRKDIEEAVVRLGTELLGEQPPDLLDLSHVIRYGTGSTVTVEELLKNGYVLDLSDFIENSETVELSDYEDVVLGLCRSGESVAAIPFAYILTTLIADSDRIDCKDGWTVYDFLEKDRLLEEPALIEGMDRWNLLELCIKPNLSFFVDEKTGECHLDREEFRMVAQRAAQLPDHGGSWPSYQEKGAVVLREIQELNSIPRIRFNAYGERSRVIGFPSFDGKPKAGLEISSDAAALAICGRCRNPDIAWRFIEAYLDTELFREEDDSIGFTSSNGFILYGIPVNCQKREAFLRYLMKEGGGLGYTPSLEEQALNQAFYPEYYLEQPLKREDADCLHDITAIARPTTAREKIYLSIIEEELEAYFAGGKTLDEVIDIMNNRIELYLAEQ